MRNKKIVIAGAVAGAFVLLCLCLVIIGVLVGPDEEQPADEATTVVVVEEATEPAEPTPEPTEEPTATPEPEPTNTPEPTATLEPAETLTPEEALQLELEEILSPSNRDVARIREVTVAPDGLAVTVEWNINDNLNLDMLVGGAQIDALEMVKALANQYGFIRLTGYFPSTDGEDIRVIQALFTAESLALADPGLEEVIFDEVWTLAEVAEIHPNFRPSE